MDAPRFGSLFLRKGEGGKVEEEEEETGFSRNNTGETRVILLSV